MTCPQGTVSFTKAGETEAVSCANSPGPALALAFPSHSDGADFNVSMVLAHRRLQFAEPSK